MRDSSRRSYSVSPIIVLAINIRVAAYPPASSAKHVSENIDKVAICVILDAKFETRFSRLEGRFDTFQMWMMGFGLTMVIGFVGMIVTLVITR